MTKYLGQCPDCKGVGNVPHVPRVLLEGEIANPNDLDRYKTIETCWHCKGGGKRMIEVDVSETP
jgi:hypothetical protein